MHIDLYFSTLHSLAAEDLQRWFIIILLPDFTESEAGPQQNVPISTTAWRALKIYRYIYTGAHHYNYATTIIII